MVKIRKTCLLLVPTTFFKRIKSGFFIAFLLLNVFVAESQNLKTVEKPYGGGYAITVIVPSVDNFTTLLSFSESQFVATMKRYGYFEENSDGHWRSFWNGSLDNFAYASCVNTYLYDILNEKVRFFVSTDMVYPSGCITELYRELKPYHKDSRLDTDNHVTDFFGFKKEGYGYFFTITHKGSLYDISAWRQKR